MTPAYIPMSGGRYWCRVIVGLVMAAASVASAAPKPSTHHFYDGPHRVNLIIAPDQVRHAPAGQAVRVAYLSHRDTERPRATVRHLLTRELAVRVRPGDDVAGLARKMGLSVLRKVTYGPNTYILQANTPLASLTAANRLYEQGKVVFAAPLLLRQHAKRFTPDDPMFPDQWHLDNTGQGDGTPGEDINVLAAWDTTLGTGVAVAVVDDGCEIDHEDLTDNYSSTLSYDFNEGDGDPSPVYSDDNHGTAVSGVAVARGHNLIGVTGAASRATLAALRLIAEPVSDETEADALTHENQSIAIYNASWGPEDDGMRLEGPGQLLQAALADAVANGRGGKGNIYVWAGGNGRIEGDNVNYDGYANSRYTIAVAAITNEGKQSYFSEPGACLLVCAPSSGGTLGITTTDRSGADGYGDGDYCDSFGGTSASCPLAAGCVALMLAAEPDLGWRDVQHILAATAKKNDPDDSDWTVNGAGFWVNHKYGFGRLDATAAVGEAQRWTNVGPVTQASGSASPSAGIPDNDQTGVTSQINIADGMAIEHVEVDLVATHTRRGDLYVELTAPSGTVSILADVHGDTNPDYDWTFMTARCWGESAQGDWVLRVSDRAAGDIGTFNSWAIRLYGTTAAPIPPPPEITTDSLPAGLVGSPYGPFTMSADGGQTPLHWVLAVSGQETDLGESLFAGGGQPQNWRADQSAWLLPLPFDFPFYGTDRSWVRVSTKGYLQLVLGDDTDYTNTTQELIDNVRIAPMWTDIVTNGAPGQDIYLQQDQHSVTIRWVGELWATAQPVDFECVLFDDGRVRFNYGPGNTNFTTPPTVGISAGNGSDYVISMHNGASSLTYANSVELPAIAPGINMEDTGVVAGTPAEAGQFMATFLVTDAYGRNDEKQLQLTVEVPGDFDQDGDVDADDYVTFSQCYTGPGGSASPECTAGDLDGDQDIDLIDMGTLQVICTGPSE